MQVTTQQKIELSRDEVDRIFNLVLDDLTVGAWACDEKSRRLPCRIIKTAKELQALLRERDRVNLKESAHAD